MLKIHFKIAWRNITSHKTSSLVNILGLALGIASCLVIYHLQTAMIDKKNEYFSGKFGLGAVPIYRQSTRSALKTKRDGR